MEFSLPFLTADLPGTGGRLKQSLEDFVVEEIPMYEPSGEGEHVFLWIEKQNTTTPDLIRHIAQVIGARQQDIGTAGLKDRVAVTRQYVSVPARYETRLDAIDTDQIHVLRSVRHRNKLRTGHLKGNQFTIVVRDVCAEAMERASAIQRVIERQGFPNYFGEQRFGTESQTLQMGLDLLRGKLQPRDLPASQRRFLLRLSVSAVQSMLFNTLLSARIRDGLLGTVLSGDVMQVVASGGPFVVEDVTREQSRCEAREICLTGPLLGPKMKQPERAAKDWENRILEQSNLRPEDFRKFPRLARGTRRPYLAWPTELRVTSTSVGLQFKFLLPRGSYATVLLREFLK